MIQDLAPETESDDTPRKIMAYINEHYGDSSLSVTSASEAFSMSSSYLSTYFKKHLDVTFSKYLEGLRIEKACELIRNSDLNIEAIATEVGYTSSLSFRRVFEKKITPENRSFKKILRGFFVVMIQKIDFYTNEISFSAFKTTIPSGFNSASASP